MTQSAATRELAAEARVDRASDGAAWRSGPLVVVAVLLAVALVLTALAVDLWRLQREAAHDAARVAHALNRAFAEHASQTVRAVAAHLNDVAAGEAFDAALARRDAAALRERLQARLGGLPQVAGALVVDRHGVIAHIGPSAAAIVQAVERPFSGLDPADRTDALLFDEPLHLDEDGRTVLPVGRRAGGRDGASGGVVVALIDPTHFGRFYNAIVEHGAYGVALVTRSGRLVAQAPRLGRQRALVNGGAQLFDPADLPPDSVGTFRAPDRVTGAAHHYAYRAVPDTDLLITTEADAPGALEIAADGWWTNAAIGAGLIVLLCALCPLAVRHLKRATARHADAEDARRDVTTATLAAHIRALKELETPLTTAKTAAESVLHEVQGRHRDLVTMRARLAHAQEMADLAVDAAELGTWSYEIERDHRDWSDRTRAFFGVALDAPITRETFWSAVHPDDRDAIRCAVEACTRIGTTFETDFRVCTADRGTRWMRGRGRAVRTADGRPLRILGVMFDIDERRHAEVRRLDLLRRLIRVQEDERAHLARELHDELGQHLTALSLGLKRLEHALPPDCTPDLLASLQAAVSQLSSEVHRIAWALRPTALDDFGLRQAMTNFVGDWSERTGIACDVHWQESESGRLSSDVETAVYRAVQEALTNVRKHAHAARASVVVERRGHTLQVIVEDDGIGLDLERALANPDRRLGLAGMRERLGLVGGRLTIESTLGVGTTLYMRIALADAELAA